MWILQRTFMLRSTWERITDRNAPGTTASRVVSIANTQPPHLPITLQDNGNAANETYALNNPKGMLYGDQQHRYNILGELAVPDI